MFIVNLKLSFSRIWTETEEETQSKEFVWFVQFVHSSSTSGTDIKSLGHMTGLNLPRNVYINQKKLYKPIISALSHLTCVVLISVYLFF